ncbi:hypothetical protein [Sphingobacterium detergens]|uniref:Uncharacterized protein n=1 Tax=Sphingobacterium detergens TaxID=1145106 RepID=A0A420BFA0_SPHD1|nr:hypothetical protein [Sphingobacterium detergens]RKE55358.1 hypothetical protein DFQ12_0189 [Sphingobacterium detergens]
MMFPNGRIAQEEIFSKRDDLQEEDEFNAYLAKKNKPDIQVYQHDI